MIRYWVLGVECSREEAKAYWSAECARSGRHPFEVKIFEEAERAEDGEQARKILSKVADIAVVHMDTTTTEAEEN